MAVVMVLMWADLLMTHVTLVLNGQHMHWNTMTGTLPQHSHLQTHTSLSVGQPQGQRWCWRDWLCRAWFCSY